MDNMSSMPPEVLLHVLSFLKPSDLLQTRAVCSEWKILSEDHSLWKSHLKEIPFPGAYQEIPAYWHSKRAEQLLLTNTAPTLTLHGLPDIAFNYIVEGQELFLPTGKNLQIRDLKNYQITATLQAETKENNQLFLTQKQIVAFSDWEKILTVWDRQTKKISYSLNLNPQFISNVLTTEKQIAIAFTDGAIKIWNIEDGQLLHELSVDEGEGNEIQLFSNGNELIATAASSTIKFWDMDSGQLLKIEDVNSSIITCKVADDLLIASCENNTLPIWHLPSKQLIATLDSPSPLNVILSMSGDHLIASTQDHSLLVWSLASKQLLHTLSGHDKEIKSVSFRGNQLFAATESGSIYRWDLKKGTLLQEISDLKGDRVNLIKMTLTADKIMASFMEDVEIEDGNFQFNLQNNFRIWDLAKS